MTAPESTSPADDALAPMVAAALDNDEADRVIEWLTSHMARHGPTVWSQTTLVFAAIDVGDLDIAFEAAHAGMALFGETAATHAAMARIQVTNDLPAAHKHAAKALALAPENPHVLAVCGRVAAEAGDCAAAEAHFSHALAIKPNHIKALMGQAHLYLLTGQTEAAAAAFQHALTYAPRNGAVHHAFALAHVYTDKNESSLQQMLALHKDETLSDLNRTHVCFALGKAFEDLREFDSAFSYFKQGNALHRKRLTYDREARKSYGLQLKEVFNTDFLRMHRGDGQRQRLEPNPKNPTPVFIIGMPRSGTTLLEQILARHPQVCAMGELNFVHRLALGESQRITGKMFPDSVADFVPGQFTAMGKAYSANVARLNPQTNIQLDKMPDNFQFIGLIMRMLPNAKFIHCRRDPMGSCLSLYQTLFGTGYEWTFDLKDLAVEYHFYEDLMAHWHTVTPGTICDIQYEKLALDPEPTIRKVVDYLGLPWDKSCLGNQQGTEVIRTASVTQARKPVYTSSTDRWKAYEAHLAPLRAALNATD